MTLFLRDSWQWSYSSIDLVCLVLACLLVFLLNFAAYHRIIKPRQQLNTYEINSEVNDKINDEINDETSVTKRHWQRFIFVAFFNVLTFICLVALVISINFNDKVVQPVVLITPGTTQLQLEQISLIETTKIYLLATFLADSSSNLAKLDLTGLSPLKRQLKVIKSAEQLALLSKNINALAIYGDGLTPEQWEHFSDVAVSFYPSIARSGLLYPRWQKHLPLGQPLIVTSQYQYKPESRQQPNQAGYRDVVEIALFDPFDNKVASERVQEGEYFSLSAQPKTAGQYIYRLKILAQNQAVLSDEPVAVSVEKHAALALFIKQSAPSFETKHLKTWAGQQGASIVLQTQVSKNKTIGETINLQAGLVFEHNQPLNPELLAQFDLFLIDGRALLTMTETNTLLLQQAVLNGLGVFIFADQALSDYWQQSTDDSSKANHAKFWLAGFSSKTVEQDKETQLSDVFWSDNVGKQALNISQGTLISAHGVSLASGTDQQTLVLNRSVGLGHIAIGLIRNSYQWQLQGEPLNYSQFWQHLFAQISRSDASETWLSQSETTILRLGVPTAHCAKSAQAQTSSPQLFLLRSLDVDEHFCGKVWPNKKGWQALDLFAGNKQVVARQWHYVYGEKQWPIWQQARSHQASILAAQQSSAATAIDRLQTLDKTVIWLIFFCSLTLLWLERKSFSSFR